MNEPQTRGHWFAASAVVAFLLAIYPLPMWLLPARPDWLGLFVMFWTLRFPARMGMRWAWGAGLVLDGLTGGILGMHALALTTVAYVSEILRVRMLLYAQVQQMGVVFLVTLMDQLLCHWIENLSGHRTPDWLFVAGSLTSALVWPLLWSGVTRERSIDGWKPSA